MNQLNSKHKKYFNSTTYFILQDDKLYKLAISFEPKYSRKYVKTVDLVFNSFKFKKN